MLFVSDGTNASLTTNDATPTRLLTLNFAGSLDAMNLELYYALIDDCASILSTHFADADAHEGGADLAAITILTEYPVPPANDLGRYHSYLNALVQFVVDHAQRLEGNVHSDADIANFAYLQTLPWATDVPSGVALVNELKDAINAHVMSVTVHTETGATVTAADAVANDFRPGIGKASVSVNLLAPTPEEGRVLEYKAGLRMDTAGAMHLIGTPTNTVDAFDPGSFLEFANVTIGVTGGTFHVDVTGVNPEEIFWSGSASVGFEFLES